MASFFLAEIDEICDPEMYREYVNRASPIVRRYGGRYVLRSEHITPVSGAWEPRRIILIRFDNPEDLRQCFASEAYLAVKALREQSTKSRAVIIEDEPHTSQSEFGDR